MALNITKFFDKRPYLPYRYKAEIYYRTQINVPYRFMIQNISFPKMDGNMDESSIKLGNSRIFVPTYNIASRQLEITFEESDNMDVTKLLNILGFHAYSGVSELVGIIVYEYDSTMRINLNTSKIYKCKLLSYDNPSFSRTGSVNVVTISASFTVFSESPYSDDNKTKMINDIKNKNRNRSSIKDLNANDIISINKEKSILKANPQYNVNLVTPQAPQSGYGGGFTGGAGSMPDNRPQGSVNYANNDEKTKEFLKQPILAKKDRNAVAPMMKGGPEGISPSLKVLMEDAKAKGIDVSSIEGATKYVYEYLIKNFGASQHQCTRGTAIIHELVDYAKDVKAGVDRSKTETYQGAVAAHTYDVIAGVTTQSKAASNFADAVSGLYTKNTSLIGNNYDHADGNMNTEIAKLMNKTGDYVTYEVLDASGKHKTQHIVSLYIDESGKRHYFSDFDQNSINVYSSESYAGCRITNIQVYNVK